MQRFYDFSVQILSDSTILDIVERRNETTLKYNDRFRFDVCEMYFNV